MSLKLRLARPDDAPTLTKIMHQAKASWGYSEELMREWRDHWQITPALLQELDAIVAEENGTPIAFSAIKTTSDGSAGLDYLFVAPEFQNQGTGALLLKRTEDLARQSGCTRITLSSDVYAGSFYDRHGYKTISSKPSKMAPGHYTPQMEKTLSSYVFPISDIDLKSSCQTWPFEAANRNDIADYFSEKQRQIPELWNGRTLKLTGHSFENGVLTGVCTECSYAAFLTWRDWGAPDLTTFNLFGSAVLRSSEGALLYGVMAQHTATAGQIYPMGGNLDPSDVTESGSIDMHASIARELEEETGLSAAQLDRAELLIIFDGARISISQVFDCGRPAEELRNAINAHSQASEEKELADVRIIRTLDDLKDPAIIPYARDLGRYLLS